MRSLAKDKASSLTHRILAMKFASEFILMYPLYTIMFGERGGVSAAGIGAILATGFVLSVLLEIPTGVIADKIPRKYVLVAAIFCKILGLATWLFLPYFTGYLLASGLFALGTALESGALQAYLYGTLGDEHKKSFGKFWARVSAMVMLSYTLAYIVASIIGVNYPVLLLASIAACSVGLIISLTLPLDSLSRTSATTKPKILATAVRHIKATPKLTRLLAEAVLVVALSLVLIEFMSLYYNQIGIQTRYVPLLMALGNVFGAWMFWTLHSWEGLLDKYKLHLLMLVTFLFVGSFFGGVAVIAAGVLLFTRFIRVLQVQFESNIQHLSNDETRATVSSIGSFAASLLAAGMVALIGLFAIDNVIVVPFRVALIVGVVIFALFLLFDKIRQHKGTTI